MLKLDELSFSYSRKELFKDLTLGLEPGNIYGLLGKNGAGKTTLLKIMGGLLFPERGDCIYDGMDITKREPRFLEEVFFLPEEFFLPPIKGSLFLDLRAPLYPGFDHEMFYDFIKEFDVDLSKPLNALSFGQKKKFLLSFGLSTGTKLIIMDEPTNGLDIPSKTILRRIIARAMSADRTILISTHQVKDVENLIDPIIILENGRVIFNQSTYDISSRLVMTQVKELSGDELFSQEIIGGYQIIKQNSGEEESSIDLELLFNSVIFDSNSINNAFSKEVVSE